MQNQNVNGQTQGQEEELYAEAGGKRRPFVAAPEGTDQAVLVDVRNMGEKEVFWQGASKGKKPHVLFQWQLNNVIDLEFDPNDDEETQKWKEEQNGKLYMVSQIYVNSMAPSAKMRKHIEAMLGRQLSDKEAGPRGFNLNALVGQNCQLTIVRSEKDGITYANVANVAGWNPKFGPNMEPKDFVRYKDRPKDAEGRVLYGEALKKHEMVQKMEQLVEEGAPLGIALKSPIDFAKLAVPDLEKSIENWEAAIGRAKSKQQVAQTIDEETYGEATTMTATERYTKREGVAPDIFADEGDPGYIASEDERTAILAEQESEGKKLEATTLPGAIKETVAKAGESKDGEDTFDQDPWVIAQAQASADGAELKPHLEVVFKAVGEAELPFTKSMWKDANFIGAINTFLKGKGRAAITDITGLKTAQANLVAAAIESGDITL